MTFDPVLAFYVAPLALIMSVYAASRKRAEGRAIAAREEAISAGLNQPASLHPVFDESLCIGCKSCVVACPEGDIIGLINNKAQLIEPANCIGHGACKAACPRGAISLVFGTAERGIDLPVVGTDFETNVPGIFIAGELGGMGLIRNAVEQGRQAMDAIAQRPRAGNGQQLDVVIVGAGPAGISAALGALAHGLRAVTLEQDSLGGTVAHFPRGKLVMTAPAELPLVGLMRFKEVSKEELLKFWQRAIRKTNLKINTNERVEAIRRHAHGFEVQTARATYATRHVLLAIGRRGTPRRLDVPGEELPKVVYRMIDAEQYRGQSVLVVGGGDSALEAAAALADEPGTRVTLSYRSPAFGRAKPANRARVDAAVAEGRIDLKLNSVVSAIAPGHVDLMVAGAPERLANDAVIVCAGGILPTEFLKSIGIEVDTKYGTA